MLRQDTFRKKDGSRNARLEVCSGKSVRQSFDLAGAAVVPLANPPAAFQIRLGSGKTMVLQPESGVLVFGAVGGEDQASQTQPHSTPAENASDCAAWVTALQVAVTLKDANPVQIHASSVAAQKSSIQQHAAMGAEERVVCEPRD